MKITSSSVVNTPSVFVYVATVDSSFISGFRFINSVENGTTLEVKMTNGRSYYYGGVPNDTFAKVLTADSVGKAYNELIKNVYPYVEGE